MSSAPTPVPIAVNFNVEIDASGNINVFNAAAPVVTNVIVAEHTLPTTALYDPSNFTGLLELWEPSDDQGNIKVQLADSDRTITGGYLFTGAYQTAAKALASGLEAILCDTFDCSAASPFSNYTSNVEYYKQRDFGRVALATYAHYLFGHVDATAAITNDKAFVEGMLSLSDKGDSEDAAERAAAWTKSTTDDVQSWSTASSGTDANLAIRLVKAIVAKGLDGAGVPTVSSVNDNNLSETLANIVAQVVGQDASRLMDYDNSERTRDQHILLRFIAGDIIYMNIRLRAPAVNVGATNQQVLGTTLENMYSEENFTIKITLEDPTTPPPPPPPPANPYVTRLKSTTQTGTTITNTDQGYQSWFQYYGDNIRYVKAEGDPSLPIYNIANGEPVVVTYELRDRVTNALAPAGTSVTLIMNKAWSSSSAVIQVNGTVAHYTHNGSDGATVTGLTNANGEVSFSITLHPDTPAGDVYTQIAAGETAHITDSPQNNLDIVEIFYKLAPSSGTPNVTRLLSATQGSTTLSVTNEGYQAWFQYYGSNMRSLIPNNVDIAGAPVTLTYEVRNSVTNALAPAGTSITLIMNKSYSSSTATIQVNGIQAGPVESFNPNNGATVTATTDSNGQVSFTITYISNSAASGAEVYSQLAAIETSHMNDSPMDNFDMIKLIFNTLAPTYPIYNISRDSSADGAYGLGIRFSNTVAYADMAVGLFKLNGDNYEYVQYLTDLGTVQPAVEGSPGDNLVTTLLPTGSVIVFALMGLDPIPKSSSSAYVLSEEFTIV
jgi:hypothetical protein